MYSFAPDGSVQMIKEGYNTQRQQWEKAIGRGPFDGDPSIGSLKTSFFGPFYGGYHIIAPDKEYQWVLVAGDIFSDQALYRAWWAEFLLCAIQPLHVRCSVEQAISLPGFSRTCVSCKKASFAGLERRVYQCRMYFRL